MSSFITVPSPVPTEESKYAAYKKYCKDTLNITISNDIQLMDLPYPQERGILCTGKQILKSNTTIVSVPMTSLMSILQTKDGPAGKFFERLTQDYTLPNEDEHLAVYLLFEKHLNEQSRFYSHLQLIPSSYDLPFAWTNEEIQASNGAGLYALATRMKEQIREDYARLESHVNRAGTAWNFSTKTSFTFENYVWAMCTIWSRGITLKLKDNLFVKAIAPFFDMFNHDPNAKTRHQYEISRGYLNVITTGPIIPGTQVCLNYGAYTSTDSVRLRGFLTPGNPHEFFTIQTHFTPKRADYEKRLKLLYIAPPERYDVAKFNGGVNRSEAGVLKVNREVGVIGEFQLFEDKYNEALHRSIVIEKCKSEQLDSLGEALKKKQNNVDIELELDVFSGLGEALAELRDNLAPHSDEKIHLLNITSDMEQGKAMMKEFTVRMQEKLGYVPGPNDNDTDDNGNDKNTTNDDEDDWGVSVKAKTSNNKSSNNTKGRKGSTKTNSSSSTTDMNEPTTTDNASSSSSSASSASSSASSTTTSSSSPSSSSRTFQFSTAITDTHERRLQMINYIRNVERRILQSQLEKIADAKHTLRMLVFGDQPENSDAPVTSSH